MRRRGLCLLRGRLLAVLFLGVGLLGAAGAAADTALRERPDPAREEGLLDQLVGAKGTEIVGVEAIPATASCDEHGPTPSGAELAVRTLRSTPTSAVYEVREVASNYLMKATASRARAFRWPLTAVIGPAGVVVGRLRALARDPDEDLYLPVLLDHGEPTPRVQYRFSFEFSEVFQLRWTVRSPRDGATVFGPAELKGRKGLRQICWDGSDSEGHPVPSGLYELAARIQTRGTVTARSALRLSFDVVEHR